MIGIPAWLRAVKIFLSPSIVTSLQVVIAHNTFDFPKWGEIVFYVFTFIVSTMLWIVMQDKIRLRNTPETEKKYIAEGNTYINPIGWNQSQGGEGVGTREGKIIHSAMKIRMYL